VPSVYTLLQQAIDETRAWGAIIMRPNKKQGVLDCETYIGIPKDWEHITNALDETTGNGRCYLSGKPVLIEGVTIEQPTGGTTTHYMSAIAVVPIKKANRVAATLEVIKDKKSATFTPNEVKKLESIAFQLVRFV
jgi:hypothetical protein